MTYILLFVSATSVTSLGEFKTHQECFGTAQQIKQRLPEALAHPKPYSTICIPRTDKVKS
jgi:hypothetical protein